MNLHDMRRASLRFIDHPRVLICVNNNVSTESGMPTFHNADGMFTDPHITHYTHVETFELKPTAILPYYQEQRIQLQGIKPNPDHYTLIKLAATKTYTIATQHMNNLLEIAAQESGTTIDIHH